ncbi:MAG: HDIG domain-containing protein [Candidatus Hydrothermia bacterium]|nr:HDIG domain-containing protein [Candidatus Hydrothermia bacterium]
MKNIANFLLFFTSAVICSIFVPEPYNNIKINEKSKFDIYAPYNLKILKNKEELKAESINVISRTFPILIYDEVKIYKDKNHFESILADEIEKIQKLGIISDEDFKFLQNDPSEKVGIYINGEIYEKSKNSIYSFSKAYDEIISRINLIYPDSLQKAKLFLLENLKPNLKLDLRITNENRRSALKTIKKEKFEINKGELIVKKGDVIDKETYEKIKAIYGSRNKLFVFIIISTLFLIWAGLNITRKKPSFSNNIILNMSIIFFSVLHSFLINYGFNFSLNFSPFFSLLLSFIIPKNIVINFATTSSIVLGIYYNLNFSAFVYSLVISIFSVFISNFIKRRFEIVLFSTILMPIAILTLFSLKQEILNVQEILEILISTTLSFSFCAIVIYIIEKTTRLTTTFNLLDIASLEHPLIKMLREKAPGTYNHSINVSILAQEAAEELSANALLCKVGAYFHDIGKIENPQYFIENQTGYNPHDELNPIESAKIIISHVENGVKLAKKYGLPNAIINIIKTHHGTTILEPFYKKAILENPDVDKKLFQYPGPNPSTKEEAIIMLADSVEASVRSLKEKDKESIRRIVRGIINERWENGYLELTDLKRKDLEKIEEVFIKVLESIYHPRISYD